MRRRNRKIKAMIELTPLVDMVFLLLIFFMTTTTFIKSENSINIDLPRGGDHAHRTQQQIVVEIDKEGQYFLNQSRIDEELLGVGLKNAIDVSEQKNVVIKADKHVAYDKVVQVMDNARKYGAKRFFLSTLGVLEEQ